MGVVVGRDRLNAGGGSAADDRNGRSRSNRQFVAEALHDATLFCVEAWALFVGELDRSLVSLGTNVFEQAQVPRLGHAAFKRDTFVLEHGVEAHETEAHGTFALGGVFRLGHVVGRALDEVFEDIVEEAHHVLDELLIVLPLVIGLSVQRAEAADSGAVVAEVILARVQHDLCTEV